MNLKLKCLHWGGYTGQTEKPNWLPGNGELGTTGFSSQLQQPRD